MKRKPTESKKLVPTVARRLVCPATTSENTTPKKLKLVPLVIHVTDEKGEEHDFALHS